MFGSILHTRRSAAGGSRSALIAILLCLTMLLPTLPEQGTAAPDERAASLRAQQPGQPLIAFLRQGDVWVANADGTNEQQLTTDGEAEVTMFGFPAQGGEPSRVDYTGFSWSPDGRYLAITKDGSSRTREILLFDAQTSELSTLLDGIDKSAYLPAWATDANELLVPKGTEEVASSGRQELLRVLPDGTVSEAPSFESGRPICGLPSGPGILPAETLMLRETLVLRDMVDPSFQWSATDNRALINRWCWAPQWLDLTSGEQTPVLLPGEETKYAQRGPGSLLMRPGDPSQGIAVGAPLFTTLQDLQLFHMDSASLETIANGYLAAWHPDGERIIYSRSTTVAEHEVSTASYPWTLRENSTAVYEVQRDGTSERLIAELPVYGVGWPSISHDGEWLIVSAVENPTEAIANIPAGSQVTEAWIGSYPPPVNLYRVDIETGQGNLVVENAGWPKVQPGGTPAPVSDDEPTDLTGSPTVSAPEATAEPTEAAEQPVTTSSDGWIAYSGVDGNIWLSRPDGSDQRRVTTDGSPDRPYIHPNWSPDGTMLVFSTRNAQEESGNDIYLLRDGEVTRVPVIHNCYSAAFTADGARLLMLCAAERSSSPPSDTYPPEGLVSIVDLDGSNWEVVAPFPLEIDGSDPLWWTMLFTTEIDVSPLDGEILVNSIFMSSARVPQIHLIDGSGEWDAVFGAPPDGAGRIWGRFSADGTSILARLCRGCYKDSPGPPNTSMLLVDREGNLVETLYTPEASVMIGSFAQSPDGTRLLLRTTTEETDFDIGTAGLTYITQMVDIASGTVTEVPIDGGDFAWQPVTAEIAVPESTAGLQPTTQFLGTAPVVAIACTTTSEEFALSTDGPILPDGCSVAEGMRFTVSGANGEAYGQCVIGSAAFCSQPEIWMPVDVEVTVTVDESTIPEGYAVVGGNPQVFTFESRYLNTDAAQWLIVLMPAEVAARQGDAPAGESAEASETETAEVTESGSASSLTIEPGSDWIAYTGEDGNIWLMQPDGGQQTRVTSDGTPDFPYRQPSWSHDGTMLVFSRQATYSTSEPSYLYLFRDGVVSRIPTVYGCDAAAFMPGDQQLVLGCSSDSAETEVPASTLQADPSMGFVSLANLDGSDWHLLMPYPTDPPGWPNVGRAWVWDINVAVDGTILLNWGGPDGDSMALMAPGSSSATRLSSPLESGSVTGRFFPGSDDILINACKGCYKHSSEDAQHTVAWMDRSGAVTTTLMVPDPVTRIGMPTISPDGMTLVYTIRGQGYPFYGSIQSRDLASGTEVTIASGMEPTWQPNPGVAMERPAAPVMTGSGGSTGAGSAPVTETASTGQPVPAQSSSTVPNDFMATWSGRGVQENPYGEWAVTIAITGGGVGEVVGTSEYPEEGCGGNLILQEVTADSIVLLEQLTYGQEACADGGTITLFGIDNVAVQFGWSGIGPYGTPSTASGTLYRPDSVTGSSAPVGSESASQSGDQSYGPAQDTTQLHPDYIGTYSGTGNQTDPHNEWPITVTFTGGRPGEVIGTVEYPTLGCGGELILVSINPVDEWRGFQATERITFGHDNCIDGGTFGFSTAESGIGITFSWRSPVSATRASGHLPEVEPGAASSQSGAEPAASRSSIDFFIGTWEGTGTQSNNGATWPIAFVFTGGGEGAVVGTVDYPTLGCGGEVTLVRNLVMPGVTSGIELAEHITYGADNCIDGGTFEIWLAEGGGRTGFTWVSPDGDITAEGPIDMVERGAAPASVPDESPAMEPAGGGMEPAEPGASDGGPPSIYDDPEAEPVPIEAEGG